MYQVPLIVAGLLHQPPRLKLAPRQCESGSLASQKVGRQPSSECAAAVQSLWAPKCGLIAAGGLAAHDPKDGPSDDANGPPPINPRRPDKAGGLHFVKATKLSLKANDLHHGRGPRLLAAGVQSEKSHTCCRLRSFADGDRISCTPPITQQLMLDHVYYGAPGQTQKAKTLKAINGTSNVAETDGAAMTSTMISSLALHGRRVDPAASLCNTRSDGNCH